MDTKIPSTRKGLWPLLLACLVLISQHADGKQERYPQVEDTSVPAATSGKRVATQKMALGTAAGNEQIKWQVVGSGGTRTISGNRVVWGTAGQNAIGRIDLEHFSVLQGFWQDFAPPCKAGDANNDGSLDISDAVYLIGFIFAGGPAPVPFCHGDTNGDGIIDISDVVAMVNYVFASP